MSYQLWVFSHQEDMIDFVILHLLLASIEHSKLFLKSYPFRFSLSACNEWTNKWLCLDNLHLLSPLFVACFNPGQLMHMGLWVFIVRLIVFFVFILNLRHRLISHCLLFKNFIDRLLLEGISRVFTAKVFKVFLLEFLVMLLNHCL